MQFEDRVVLVTGAGRGIGRALALAFAREGAEVVVHYGSSRDAAERTAEEVRSLGRQPLVAHADMAQKIEIDRLYDQAVAHFGRLDVLVNNAAVFSSTPLEQVTEEEWDRVLDVNLKGVFFSCQAAAGLMLGRGQGVIVNLSSGGGLAAWPGYRTSPAYAASKAGVIMLTRHLARDLAPHVRVNCVTPGIIDSKPEPMSEPLRERLAERVPLRRVGEMEDIAQVVVFLASPAAAYMTGQVVNVDGGVVMY